MKKLLIVVLILTVGLLGTACDSKESTKSSSETQAASTEEATNASSSTNESADTTTDSSEEQTDKQTTGESTTENSSEEVTENTEQEANTENEKEDSMSNETMTDQEVIEYQLSEIKEGDVVVEIQTSMGTLVIKLFPEQAPKTVENFVTHAKNGYYDNQIFHRVINDFMIQGGDPTGTGTGGESIWGSSFEDEIYPVLFPYRGALCMANAGPNTNGSQFFVVQSSEASDDFIEGMINGGFPQEVIDNYAKLGGTPWLYGKHTVFGQVVEGYDVLDAIAGVPVGAGDKPVEDVVIQTIVVREK